MKTSKKISHRCVNVYVCVAAIIITISMLTLILMTFIMVVILQNTNKKLEKELLRDFDSKMKESIKHFNRLSDELEHAIPPSAGEKYQSLKALWQEYITRITKVTSNVRWRAESKANRLLDLHRPAPSCASIFEKNPSFPSGYYYTQVNSAPPRHMYCERTTRTCGHYGGQWTRIAGLDMRRNLEQCPPNLCINPDYPNSCIMCPNGKGCSLNVYSVGFTYSKVCGRVIGFQKGTPDAFGAADAYIFDGIQITHSHPPVNIWSFVAAETETDYTENTCPCINSSDSSIHTPPEFVENNYFCDSGSETVYYGKYSRIHTFYGDDPLWDGHGCGGSSTCCSYNEPPWFYRDLVNSTSDDIELKICRDSPRYDEDIVVQIIDIFVQ